MINILIEIIGDITIILLGVSIVVIPTIIMIKTN